MSATSAPRSPRAARRSFCGPPAAAVAAGLALSASLLAVGNGICGAEGRAFAAPPRSGRRSGATARQGTMATDKLVQLAAAAGEEAARHQVRLELLAAAAASCRGQCGGLAAQDRTLRLVDALEALNPMEALGQEMDLMEGEWQLVFASEDVTRSSPFFWGWRQLLRDVQDPLPLSRLAFGTERLSESIFAITDNVPGKSIGEATQSITDGRLVNRVALQIFGVGRTMMTTTCRILPAEIDTPSDELTLAIETTQAVDSTWPFTDSVVFPSETFLGDAAQVRMQITYLDEAMRVVRVPADGQVFVYVRVE